MGRTVRRTQRDCRGTGLRSGGAGQRPYRSGPGLGGGGKQSEKTRRGHGEHPFCPGGDSQGQDPDRELPQGHTVRLYTARGGTRGDRGAPHRGRSRSDGDRRRLGGAGGERGSGPGIPRTLRHGALDAPREGAGAARSARGQRSGQIRGPGSVLPGGPDRRG